MPGSYKYEFLDTRLHYEYSKLCILDYSEQELGESDNPFAWVVIVNLGTKSIRSPTKRIPWIFLNKWQSGGSKMALNKVRKKQ
jgi:hypothetical protein